MDATVRNRKHGCQTEKEGMSAGKGQDACWERENNREEKDNVQRYEIGQNESKKRFISRNRRGKQHQNNGYYPS